MTKTLITLLTILCFLPLYSEGQQDGKKVEMTGVWEGKARSLTPEIPISGRVSNGLLILTNECPDRPIVVTLTDSQRSIIIRKEFPQENTSYMVIPLDGLQEGETYIVTLTSPYPVDCLTAFVNLKKSYSYETRRFR